MRALYACTQPKIHTALHFIENSNVYHALLLSKASQFSCCAVQNISNSLAAYFFSFFLSFTVLTCVVVAHSKFKIHSVAVGLTDIWILWSFVRKRIHLKFKTFWFCLFLFSKQNISYLSMLFHFQQTFASSNLFRNIIMIMHKSLHFFILFDCIKCHYSLESKQNFHFSPWIERTYNPIINSDQYIYYSVDYQCCIEHLDCFRFITK